MARTGSIAILLDTASMAGSACSRRMGSGSVAPVSHWGRSVDRGRRAPSAVSDVRRDGLPLTSAKCRVTTGLRYPMGDFIDEDDLLTLEGFLKFQGIDPAAISLDELKEWSAIFNEGMLR